MGPWDAEAYTEEEVKEGGGPRREEVVRRQPPHCPRRHPVLSTVLPPFMPSLDPQ